MHTSASHKNTGKQPLEHLLLDQPSKPRASPAKEGPSTTVKSEERGGMLLAKLAAKPLSASNKAANGALVAPNCLRTAPDNFRSCPKGNTDAVYGKRRGCCNFRKKHVFTDLLSNFCERPSSAALLRPKCLEDATKSSSVLVGSKKRKTSRKSQDKQPSAWFWVLFARRATRPSRYVSTTSRQSHCDNLCPAQRPNKPSLKTQSFSTQSAF